MKRKMLMLGAGVALCVFLSAFTSAITAPPGEVIQGGEVQETQVPQPAEPQKKGNVPQNEKLATVSLGCSDDSMCPAGSVCLNSVCSAPPRVAKYPTPHEYSREPAGIWANVYIMAGLVGFILMLVMASFRLKFRPALVPTESRARSRHFDPPGPLPEEMVLICRACGSKVTKDLQACNHCGAPRENFRLVRQG